jgi:predicted nucleotidyltransferase
MQTLQEIIRGVLRRYPDVRLCIVFGSAASGKTSAESDLDVAVAADQPLTADRRLELTEAFSAAANREVDLVDLMAVSGPILRQALSKGAVVTNRDKGLYARLISRMLFNQADMMPYYDRILRERRARFLNG